MEVLPSCRVVFDVAAARGGMENACGAPKGLKRQVLFQALRGRGCSGDRLDGGEEV